MRIWIYLRQAKKLGVGHPLEALLQRRHGVLPTRHDGSIDLARSGRDLLRTLNPRLPPKEAEYFAHEIDALFRQVNAASAWAYAEYALRHRSMSHYLWPTRLQAVICCPGCGSIFRRPSRTLRCSQCRKRVSARTAAPVRILMLRADWLRRAAIVFGIVTLIVFLVVR